MNRPYPSEPTGHPGCRPSGLCRLTSILSLVVFLLLLLPGAPATSQAPSPLLWPLPIKEGCTSSFGEYRRNHFHGGVDFRTHQEIGWPVLAVADGKISHFRREPFGYGRVIYLELADGRTAVYGHVCRFENASLKLEDRLRQACEKAGKSFPGDLPLDPPLPVKAGDVIAYSGDLGVGSPHLHLEIRRGDDMCDPFAEGLPLPEGLTAPQFAGLALVPREAPATVDGGFAPLFVPAVWSKEGSRLARAVTVSGPVDAEAVVEDHLGVKENTTGVPLLKASLDGNPFFDMDLRCVSLAAYKQSPALFDPRFDRSGATTYRLRRMPGLSVAGFRGEGMPGDAAPGPHELSVTAANRAGLPATLTGTLQVMKEELPPQTSLPGAGFKLQSSEILPSGLLLILHRRSDQGQAPLLAGAVKIEGFYVKARSPLLLEVLVPRDRLPKQGAALAAGDMVTPWLVAAGPGSITAGGARLNLPAGVIGKARAVNEPGGIPGFSAELEAGPYSAASSASVEFPGLPAKGGTGVFLDGALFLDGWSGKAVPYRERGVYGLREDRTPPSWGQARIVRIPRISAEEVRVTLTDAGAGPNAASLRLALDGRPAFIDWDPDQREIRLDVTGLKRGRHVITGTLSDFLGNSATLPQRTFVLQ